MKRKRNCGVCGGSLETVIIDQIQEYSEELGTVIFEDVPALQCGECGERWFEGQVLEAIDAVLEKKPVAPKKISISVPAYPKEIYLKSAN